MNAVVSYLFPLLQAKLGLGPVFFIFAAINYLAILSWSLPCPRPPINRLSS